MQWEVIVTVRVTSHFKASLDSLRNLLTSCRLCIVIDAESASFERIVKCADHAWRAIEASNVRVLLVA